MTVGHEQGSGRRFASDDIELPAYLPAETVKVTEWDEVIEALRSPHLLQEPPAVPGVHGGGLGFINGAEHHTRRLALNALVRPKPLARYRTSVVWPAVRSVMEETLIRDPAAEIYRVDLVAMLQRSFLQFAAAVIGLKNVDTAARREELQTVFRPLPLAHHVRFMKEGKEAAIEAAVASRNQYVAGFVAPALEDIRAHMKAHGEVSESLLGLVAQLADPAWENENYAMADAIAFLIGSVDTSTHSVAQTVYELTRWFEDHPDELERRNDVEFLNAALEEALRLRTSPPVLGRIAAADLTLANGKTIKKGQPVAVFHARANRDRSVFGDDADEFNPLRKRLRKVTGYGAAFGGGSHMCIGLRVVVGDEQATGSHAQVLKAFFEAGIQDDPTAAPTRLEGEMVKFLAYPVIFTNWSPAG
jgi:cytochrome P450